MTDPPPFVDQGQERGGRSPRTFCSFDLSYALQVVDVWASEAANDHLRDGWILLAVDVDANGFPVFILAEPSSEWHPKSEGRDE